MMVSVEIEASFSIKTFLNCN